MTATDAAKPAEASQAAAPTHAPGTKPHPSLNFESLDFNDNESYSWRMMHVRHNYTYFNVLKYICNIMRCSKKHS